MTYIEILNAFWNWRRFNVIPHSAADLYFCLLDFANAAKWEDNITVPNSRIKGKIDISEKSLFNARNVLIQNGLIEYQNGKKGQAGTYKINLTTLYFFINKGSNTGSNRGSNKGSNSGVIRGAIGGTYIDKEKEEDKIRVEEEEKREETAADIDSVILCYEKNIGNISDVVSDGIAEWLKKVEPDVIKFAIGEAARYNAPSWKYTEKVIKSHYDAGRKTLSAINSAKRTYTKQPDRNTGVYQDKGYDYAEIEKAMQRRDSQ